MESTMSWDILIRRGNVIDGGGSPGSVGDIALAADRIAALGPSLGGDANKVIDAAGPGADHARSMLNFTTAPSTHDIGRDPWDLR
jgi:N-acyl-D-amino-acid deacylase